MLDAYDVSSTRLGIRGAAQNSKIIVMAFGTPVATYSSIADEISYWYNNYDRLFFAAAGTSVPDRSVVFPARLSTVQAVTGFSTSGGVCSECSTGSTVDFAAIEGQPASGAVSLFSLNNGDPHPDVGSSGKSSNATAILGSIAALTWARNPTATRSWVLSRLINAASPTGAKSSNTGWGSPNAFCAVGGMCTAWADGPSVIEATGTYTFTAGQASSAGPFTYRWSTGETTRSKQRYVQITYATTEYQFRESVTITDQSDGTSYTVGRDVLVRQPSSCSTCW